MRLRCVETCVFAPIIMLLILPSDALAARYVPIEVRLKGVVLLKGYDSDSGERDFDEVWDNLHNVQFKATDEFTNRYVQQDTKDVVLDCTNNDAEESDLVVDDSCGGDARPRTLKIYRVHPDRFGHEWKLDNAQVLDLFYERKMLREDVADLKRPRRERVTQRDDNKKRNVAISVITNNDMLLDGSDDDDGRRDADAVWDNLPNVRLKASEAFLKEYVKDGTSVVKVGCILNVRYGGKSRNRYWHIMRVKPDEFGREWMLDPYDVKDEFEFREISRELASQLKNPKRSLGPRFFNLQ